MRTDSELDNPIWSSLRSRHRHLANSDAAACAFPPEYAPFVGVRNDDVDAAELAALIPAGARGFLLGIAPRMRDGWTSEAFRPLAQMTCDALLSISDGPDIIPLDRTHRADVLALTHSSIRITFANARWSWAAISGCIATGDLPR